MPGTVEWTYLDAGHYRASYQGRVLEVRRNVDGTDKRRYIAVVDGEIAAQSCWTIPQAKTKALRWVMNGAGAAKTLQLPDPHPPPPEQAVVVYAEPEVPVLESDGCIELPYTISGVMRVPDLGFGWNHLKTTVDMLREWGPVEGEAEPPAKVKI